MGNTELDERLDVNVNLDNDPVCNGINSWLWNKIVHEDCNKTATWVKVTRHCGSRSALRCDEHYRISQQRRPECIVCSKCPVPVSWIPL